MLRWLLLLSGILAVFAKNQTSVADPLFRNFENFYPTLREQILNNAVEEELPRPAIDRLKKLMDYTIPGGKLNRGWSVVLIFSALMKGEMLTSTSLEQAYVLGWCVEWLQAFFLVTDDLMDSSETRRGQPCWYKLAGVGTIAANDSLLLERQIFTLLHHHFGKDPRYVDLLTTFHEGITRTAHGQMLDLMSTSGVVSNFSMAMYLDIVKFKTAFYTYFLPFRCGLVLAGVADPQTLHQVREVAMAMGTYFQIQDDYLDSFGDPAVTGKVGHDIEERKCTWLAVTALDRMNVAQKETFYQHYGRPEPRGVAAIKSLYRELGLPELFTIYEDESYVRIRGLIGQVANEKVQDALLVILQRIYKRTK